MTIDLKDKRYTLEFRHLSSLGKRAQIHRAPLKAVTTCVIIVQRLKLKPDALEDEVPGIHLIAIDNALCALGDNYSRAYGRAEALRKTLERCGAFDDALRLELWARYHGVERCPTCAGDGNVLVANPTLGGSDVEPCADCQNPGYPFNAGTGWKGGQILFLHNRLLPPVRVQPPRVKVKPSAEEIAAFKAAGADKRIKRQTARGAA